MNVSTAKWEEDLKLAMKLLTRRGVLKALMDLMEEGSVVTILKSLMGLLEDGSVVAFLKSLMGLLEDGSVVTRRGVLKPMTGLLEEGSVVATLKFLTEKNGFGIRRTLVRGLSAGQQMRLSHVCLRCVSPRTGDFKLWKTEHLACAS